MKRKVTHYDYDCLNDALDILISIGMPETLTNPRSVMTLAALAEIDSNRKWRNASEAYHSTGPFTLDRVNSLKGLCNCKPGTEAAFITAFDTTSKMLKHYKEVAWDKEIWSADEPTNFLHKNGDKFIGRIL